MPKNVEKASERAPGEPQRSSVFDFLYCDTRRIGSFLSQFDNSGFLEKIVQRETASKDAKRGISVNVGGGASILGTGGTGNVGLNLTPSIGGSEGSEGIYDPLWANALTFLDFLEHNKMLERYLSQAGIGQFVLASGSLSIVDISILKTLFSNPTLKSRIIAGHTTDSIEKAERRRKNRQSNIPKSEIEIGLEVIAGFPLTVQSTLETEDASVIWCTLRDDCMIVKSGDLLLQHGVQIPGNWNIVGILDAKPDPITPPEPEPTPIAQSISAAFATMAPSVRTTIGRPPNCFGATPLMIFRAVTG